MRVWAQALIGFAWALELVLTDPYIHLNALKTTQGPLKGLNSSGPGPKGLGPGANRPRLGPRDGDY